MPSFTQHELLIRPDVSELMHSNRIYISNIWYGGSFREDKKAAISLNKPIFDLVRSSLVQLELQNELFRQFIGVFVSLPCVAPSLYTSLYLRWFPSSCLGTQ